MMFLIATLLLTISEASSGSSSYTKDLKKRLNQLVPIPREGGRLMGIPGVKISGARDKRCNGFYPFSPKTYNGLNPRRKTINYLQNNNGNGAEIQLFKGKQFFNVSPWNIYISPGGWPYQNDSKGYKVPTDFPTTGWKFFDL